MFARSTYSERARIGYGSRPTHPSPSKSIAVLARNVVQERDLAEHFSQFGEVTHVSKLNGKTFNITFDSLWGAERAASKKHHTVQGSLLQVERSSSDHTSPSKIICEACATARATVRCSRCELDTCARCADALHATVVHPVRTLNVRSEGASFRDDDEFAVDILASELSLCNDTDHGSPVRRSPPSSPQSQRTSRAGSMSNTDCFSPKMDSPLRQSKPLSMAMAARRQRLSAARERVTSLSSPASPVPSSPGVDCPSSTIKDAIACARTANVKRAALTAGPAVPQAALEEVQEQLTRLQEAFVESERQRVTLEGALTESRVTINSKDADISVLKRQIDIFVGQTASLVDAREESEGLRAQNAALRTEKSQLQAELDLVREEGAGAIMEACATIRSSEDSKLRMGATLEGMSTSFDLERKLLTESRLTTEEELRREKSTVADLQRQIRGLEAEVGDARKDLDDSKRAAREAQFACAQWEKQAERARQEVDDLRKRNNEARAQYEQETSNARKEATAVRAKYEALKHSLPSSGVHIERPAERRGTEGQGPTARSDESHDGWAARPDDGPAQWSERPAGRPAGTPAERPPAWSERPAERPPERLERPAGRGEGHTSAESLASSVLRVDTGTAPTTALAEGQAATALAPEDGPVERTLPQPESATPAPNADLNMSDLVDEYSFVTTSAASTIAPFARKYLSSFGPIENSGGKEQLQLQLREMEASILHVSSRGEVMRQPSSDEQRADKVTQHLESLSALLTEDRRVLAEGFNTLQELTSSRLGEISETLQAHIADVSGQQRDLIQVLLSRETDDEQDGFAAREMATLKGRVSRLQAELQQERSLKSDVPRGVALDYAAQLVDMLASQLAEAERDLAAAQDDTHGSVRRVRDLKERALVTPCPPTVRMMSSALNVQRIGNVAQQQDDITAELGELKTQHLGARRVDDMNHTLNHSTANRSVAAERAPQRGDANARSGNRHPTSGDPHGRREGRDKRKRSANVGDSEGCDETARTVGENAVDEAEREKRSKRRREFYSTLND